MPKLRLRSRVKPERWNIFLGLLLFGELNIDEAWIIQNLLELYADATSLLKHACRRFIKITYS